MQKMNQPLIKSQLKKDLMDAYMVLSDQERLIEANKCVLAKHADFNLFDCFKIFDAMGRGCLTAKEFEAGLI